MNKLFLAQADVNFIVQVGESKSFVATKMQRLVWAENEYDAQYKFEEHIREVSENESFEYTIVKVEITPALE